ncbi:MAG: methyltransferase domain-containing protein [Pseudomonadales bacterium]
MNSSDTSRELDYHVYAGELFDLTNRENTAYWEIGDTLAHWAKSLELGATPNILDLGAGTGNFTLRLFREYPTARYTHLDMSPEMNAVARGKYAEAGLHEVQFIESMMQSAPFENESFDFVVCINALNTAPPQGATLQAIESWLRPGGTLFLVDFGREMKILSWASYLIGSNIRKHGIRYTASWFRDCYESLRQNRKARKDQKKGAMWLHSTEELAELVSQSGLNVLHHSPCYRDYSDLVVAQKPSP